MDEKYKGTTVNERLYLSGLFDEFYAAVNARDVDKVRDLLKRLS